MTQHFVTERGARLLRKTTKSHNHHSFWLKEVGNVKIILRICRSSKSRILLLFFPHYFNDLRTVVKGNFFWIGNSVNSIKIWKKSMCPHFWKGTWKHTLGFKYPSVKAKKVGRVESQSNNKPFYNRTFIASFLPEKKGFFFRLKTQIKIPFTIFLFQKYLISWQTSQKIWLEYVSWVV